ncbi:MAG: metalloprotease TldD [Xanthomonadales bacterium]|nr:metalloprotease TldD [Gammaproteobacteria bacterium]MBT8054491.1 metalloprotease TldD [Gammaproteobacteria bacterium]NND57706.1 metalloprotease TldD [Xanthomonadales bacterium]NNK52623.1 metalloprotease TldD [Xanthomonadales bacterium]
MSDRLKLAEQQLLEPGGLDHRQLEKVLNDLMGPAVDSGDIYFQSSRHESWVLEDGLVRSGNHSIEQGVGIRAVSGDKTGFAYADEIIMPSLLQASGAARAIARQGSKGQVQAWKSQAQPVLYGIEDPMQSMGAADKVDLLRQVDAYARSRDPRVSQVIVSLSATHETILVAATDGTLAADIRPLVRLSVSVIAEQEGRREQGSDGGGGRFTYRTLLDDGRWRDMADEAVRQALVNLEAEAAPAGTMTVVLGPGWPGVLLHEAVGHGLEGDFNRKGTSAYSGRMGEKVASAGVTVVDDGTLAKRRGSLAVDDEGTPTQQNVLIENGILKNYMQDKLNAGLMNTAPTGNGRRESFAHLPMPRMTNTFMLAGDFPPEEIIASVDRGLFAANFAGGQVDITSGRFVFSASEAYLIENGRVTRPVKGATLIGNGPDVMNRVSMVGNDLKLDSGVGVCGKDGQSLPVGVGQPTLRIDGLTVGGTDGS